MPLTYWPERLEILRHCDPKHRQAAEHLRSGGDPRQFDLTHYKLRQMLVLYTIEMYVYPESLAKRPSWYFPVAFRMTVASTSKGFNCTYSASTQS
jgi:hypothetical protein